MPISILNKLNFKEVIMKIIKKHLKEIWEDESGLGTLEMVMLAVLLIGLVMAVKEPLTKMLTDKVDDIGSKVQGFSP